jgi:ATP-dependent DNA helicase RecG
MEKVAMIACFGRTAAVVQTRVPIGQALEVLILTVTTHADSPYTYHGRPFQRVGTTTSLMPQAVYQKRLLERGHSQQRWENQVAQDYPPRDLDGSEIRRTALEAINAGRLETPIESKTEVLRKFHLLREKRLTQAAVVAFAKEVLPGYPQCGLRMARFRKRLKMILYADD